TATFTITEGGTDRQPAAPIRPSIVLHDSAGNASPTFTSSISQNADRIDAKRPVIFGVSLSNVPMNRGDEVEVYIVVSSESDDYTEGNGGLSGTIAGYT